MSSERLPGKALADICGEPALALLLKRLQRAKSIGRIVVATSTGRDDDLIAELADQLDVGCSRGSLNDVLDRFVMASAYHYGPVVRITGDCPLIDPGIVDSCVEVWQRRGVDYVTNFSPRTFPDGLDCEVIDAEVLRQIAEENLSDSEREHVTLAIRRQPNRFSKVGVVNTTNESHRRWTLDTPADLEFMRALVRSLGGHRYSALYDEILHAHRALVVRGQPPPGLAALL